MSKMAFVFPGQGSQYVGMGKDLFENIPACKRVFMEADESLNMNLSELCFEGSKEELNKTENTQPALLTMSTAICEALKENGIEADILAGLSLGEYSALVYSGFMDFKEAVSLVKKRGRFMQEAVPAGIGGMIAVLNLKDEEVIKICKEQDPKYGKIECANFNCDGQVVVAGENAALDEMMKKVKEKNGKAIRLKVSAPFHCSMLEGAAYKLEAELKEIKVNEIQKKVYSNVKGTPYEKGDDIKEVLKEQVMKPVLFNTIIKNMINEGVDTFVEIGPGKTLSGFIKRTNPNLNIYNICNVETLNKFIMSYKEQREVLL